MSQRKPRSSSASSVAALRDGLPSILLAIVVVASPLAIGGVHTSTAAAVAAVSLAGLWVAMATEDDRGEKTATVAFSIPTIGFSLMALMCFLQLIPVPTSVYRLLQPTGYEALAANWGAVFGEPFDSGWHHLSLDPRATTEHALKWLALAATTALAGQVIADRRRRRRWLGIILIGGGIVAAAGMIQHFSGTDLILGFYQSEVGARSMSPFVSTNHAAVYYGLLALVGVAYGFDYLRRSPVRASLGVAATVVFLMLSATHSSTGALVAVAAGLVVFGIAVIIRFSPEEEADRKKMAIVAVALLFSAAIAAIFVPTQWTVADDAPQLDDTSAEVRIHLTQSALDAAVDHPIVGTGAGSVERTLSPYLDATELQGLTIPTIENEPIEWMMTFGPVVGLMVMIAFFFVLIRTAPHVFRRSGRRGPMVATAVMVFIGLVSLVHFPFFTLGISVVAAVVVEACLDRRRDNVFWTLSRRRALVFCALLTVAVAGLITGRATVFSPGAEADLDVEDAQRVERALQMYPTDGRLMSALSLAARSDDNDRDALELARRAYQLRPHPQQQVLLARTLALGGETEEAAELYGDLIDADRRHGRHYRWVQDRIRHDLREPELRAIALADARPAHIEQFIHRVRRQESPFVATEFALALIELRPDRPTPHLELIDLYREVDQPMLAEMYARGLVDRNLEAPDGERPAGLTALLELFEQQDRVDEARNMASRAFDAGYATPALGRVTVELMPDEPQLLDQDLRLLFENAINIGCQPPYEQNERRTCWEGRAVIAEADGRIGQAESLLRRVERLEDDPRPLASLLARHHRCRELAGVERRHEGQRHHSAIQQKLQECVRYDEPER